MPDDSLGFQLLQCLNVVVLFGCAEVKSFHPGETASNNNDCIDEGTTAGPSCDAAGSNSISPLHNVLHTSNAPGPSSISAESASSSRLEAASLNRTFDPESYVIPSSHFPLYLVSSLVECNEKNVRLPLPMKRLLVRIISNDIHLINERPGRSLLRILARRVVL